MNIYESNIEFSIFHEIGEQILRNDDYQIGPKQKYSCGNFIQSAKFMRAINNRYNSEFITIIKKKV